MRIEKTINIQGIEFEYYVSLSDDRIYTNASVKGYGNNIIVNTKKSQKLTKELEQILEMRYNQAQIDFESNWSQEKAQDKILYYLTEGRSYKVRGGLSDDEARFTSYKAQDWVRDYSGAKTEMVQLKSGWCHVDDLYRRTLADAWKEEKETLELIDYKELLKIETVLVSEIEASIGSVKEQIQEIEDIITKRKAKEAERKALAKKETLMAPISDYEHKRICEYLAFHPQAVIHAEVMGTTNRIFYGVTDGKYDEVFEFVSPKKHNKIISYKRKYEINYIE